jgi:gamma-D-glutamyl-L-lysine dipeptidyl-peptidase
MHKVQQFIINMYGICKVAAAPVRKEPNHRSEMINQLLFGETMQLLEQKDDWWKVKSLYDEYEGWLTKHLFKAEESIKTYNINYITAGLVNQIQIENKAFYIPQGSFLPGFNPNSNQLWNDKYKYNGTYTDITKQDQSVIKKKAKEWLEVPYLWGGKTLMGVDCSGFVQTIFKHVGIKLSRDAWQQAKQGNEVASLEECKENDLAFFANEEGRVTHVGILLNKNQIIHASGKVRIDTIDVEGIINSETNERTHRLHSMKRYF